MAKKDNKNDKQPPSLFDNMDLFAPAEQRPEKADNAKSEKPKSEKSRSEKPQEIPRPKGNSRSFRRK